MHKKRPNIRKTPAQLCKLAGLKSLAELAEITGSHEQTIRRWPETKPKLWAAVLLGAVKIKNRRMEKESYDSNKNSG